MLLLFNCSVKNPEVAMLHLVLQDQLKPGKNRTPVVIGQTLLTMQELRCGYRHVSLEVAYFLCFIVPFQSTNAY